MRLKDRVFPSIEHPEAYGSARVWHCGYRSLAPLAAFTALRTLEIATYPDDSLAPLASLGELESLHIVHMPNVSDLAPLASLRNLRRLQLETLPSWDVSGKATEVRSLAPIAALPNLVEVSLFGVRPPDRRVDDLLRSTTLRRASISKYPKSEIERLRQALEARLPEA